eukprot:gene14205-16552_t
MRDGRLMVVGGPDDRWAAEAVRRVIARDRLIDLVGRTDLLTVFACLKRARLFIGNDSGLMHMAAAAGAPTLGLFGPSDDRLYGPWGRHARALRGPREFESFVASDPELNQAVCHMLDLPVESVVRAARALYAESDADWRAEHGDQAPPPTPITFVRTAEPEAQRPAPPDWDPSVLGDAPRARSGMSAASFRPTKSEAPTPAPLTFRAAPADMAARPPAPVPPVDLSEPIVAPVLPKRRAAVRQSKSSAAAAVVNHSGRGQADIGVRNGRIAAVGWLAQVSAGETLDLRGLTVMPGVIDSQVHFREPGLEWKEDLETGSLAA